MKLHNDLYKYTLLTLHLDPLVLIKYKTNGKMFFF